MQISDWANVATAVAAIYVAVFGTAAAFAERHDRKSRVRVLSAHYKSRDMRDFRFTGDEEDVVMVKAINEGQVPVYLSDVSYRFKGTNQYAMILKSYGDNLPYHLPPGKSCKCYVRSEAIADGMEKPALLEFYFADETGRNHWSKPIAFDPANFRSQHGEAAAA